MEWFKNGAPLSKAEGITSRRGNRHTLLLPGIRRRTFGDYECRATNKYGQDMSTTRVSGEKKPQQGGAEKRKKCDSNSSYSISDFRPTFQIYDIFGYLGAISKFTLPLKMGVQKKPQHSVLLNSSH